MTHPLDVFRSLPALNASCAALFPGDPDSVNACVTSRAGQAQSEIFEVSTATGVMALGDCSRKRRRRR